MRMPQVRPRALPYYLASTRTLVGAVRNWPLLLWDLAGLPIGRPYPMRLRDGVTFRIRSHGDLLRLFTDRGLRTRHFSSPVQAHQGFIHAFNPDVG